MAVIGELPTVPEPGAGMASQWALDVSNRIQHRFANKGALDGWTTALGGTRAVTVDDGVEYQRCAGGWARMTPYHTAVVGTGGTWTADR